MKIVQINSVCGVTGTGRIVTDLYDIAVKNDNQCLIAYGEHKFRNQPGKREVLEIGSMKDCRMHALRTRLLDGQGFGSAKATKQLVKQLDSIKPDVIHLHNLHGYYINIELLFEYIKEKDIPVVWTLHDCWAFTGHCVHFLEAGCDRWKTQCHDCPLKQQYPGSLVMDGSSRNYARKKDAFTGVKNMTLIVPSNWLADYVRNSFLREYPIRVVPNGIDLELFQPTPSSFRLDNHIEDKFVILGVANIWVERKGLDTFLKIAAALDEQYQVVLVGLSKEQIEALPGNIIGLPRTDTPTRLVELYSMADVFVHPGREETFGLTVAEAIACDTWPIVYSGTACEEVVRGACGSVVEGDVDEMIRTIQSCKENGLPTGIHEKAECFSKAHFGEEVLAIYQNAATR